MKKEFIDFTTTRPDYPVDKSSCPLFYSSLCTPSKYWDRIYHVLISNCINVIGKVLDCTPDA